MNEEQISSPEVKDSKAKVYDSNPFTTSITGIKQLFSLNTGPFIASVFFTIGIVILIAITIAAMASALIPFLSELILLPPSGTADLSSSTNSNSMYATLFIGLALLVGLIALLQSVQIKLASASALGQRISFSKLFAAGFARLLPLLGYFGITLGVMVVVGVLLFILGSALGPITYALAFIAIVALLYVSIRLLFASFSIVEEKQNPIQAIKQSWQLTEGHMAETVGIVAASALIMVVPMVLIDTLSNATTGSAYDILQFIGGLVVMTAGTLTLVATAKRYQQLQMLRAGKAAAPAKPHILNYLAVVFIILAAILLGSVQSQTSPSEQEFQDYLDQLELDQPTTQTEYYYDEQQQQGGQSSEYNYPSPGYNVN
jgi:uncharacterized membrane protein YidH (DUF202 family)